MLRDEITDKQTVIEDLRDSKRELTLIHEQLVRDYERLKQEESDKSHKLHDLLGANERREQARQDLKVTTVFVLRVNLEYDLVYTSFYLGIRRDCGQRTSNIA